MKSLSQPGIGDARSVFSAPVALVVGDILAFLLFVVVGRISHGFTSDWLVNVARIATPFLIGWLVVSLPIGAYRASRLAAPASFLGLSIVAVLAGDLVAFFLRAVLFQNNVTVPFALTTLAFTTLFVVGWRAVYVVWYNR